SEEATGEPSMKKNFRIWIFAATMLLGVAFAPTSNGALAASPDAAASSVEITIDNFSFTPMTVTVKAGTTITWKNRDDIPHTVVSSDNLFKSKTLDTDDKFSFTPTKPGTYSYFCSIHPKMTAKLVVE
ncbi:MAG: cupredoxin family copper-binding protein, partial [Terriglobales bacterium]